MGILNRKKKRSSMGLGLADHKLSPRTSEEQDAPEQERQVREDEKAETAVHELTDPPQAEGPRRE